MTRPQEETEKSSTTNNHLLKKQAVKKGTAAHEMKLVSQLQSDKTTMKDRKQKLHDKTTSSKGAATSNEGTSNYSVKTQYTAL